MTFLLDTNICSAHVERNAGLTHYFVQYSGRIYVPTPVVGELYTWAHQRPSPQPLIDRIEKELLADVQLLDFDKTCACEFGRLNGQLLRSGFVASPVDLMIAAVALVHDYTLVTNNTRDFERVPGLTLVDWLKP